MRNLFLARIAYEEHTKEGKTAIFDNWSDRQFLYGKVNKKNRTVAPLDRSSMKKILGSDDIFVLNFVADAFQDLTDYYVKTLNSPTNSQFQKLVSMETLTARRGYVKPIGLYRQKMVEARNIFVSEYLFGHDIKTFDQVLDRFYKFIADYANKIPMLYSVFMGSSSCPIHCSGLVIELTLDFHDSIDAKIDFLADGIYYLYEDMISKFGFLPAKHAPWCLVANLEDPIMHEYAKFYDVKKISDMVDEYYYECKDFDIDLIREFVYESFIQLQEQDYVETTHRICNNKTVTSNVLREAVDIKKVIDDFDNDQWVEIYLRILILQSGVTVSETRLQMIISEFMVIYRQTDFEKMYKFVIDEIEKLPKSLDIQSQILYSSTVQMQQILLGGASGGVSGY